MIKTCISKNWLLKTPESDKYISVDLPNDYSVTMPRDSEAPGMAFNGFFMGGTGIYLKDIKLGEKPRRYIVDIDGAYMCADISLNGSPIIMHPYGYTPILVDITPKARFGEVNRLKIVTNALQCSTRWYTGAGIYRDVYMWEGGDIRIEPRDVFVSTPTLDTVNIAYEVRTDRKAAVTLCTEIIAADGTPVAKQDTELQLEENAKTPATVTFVIENAIPWSTENPYLYTVKTTVFEDGEVVDTDLRTFGIRTVTADAKNGLMINGKTVKLRGGCIHHDHGVLGAADFPAACKRKLTLLKQAGFNAIRIAHNPPSRNLLEMCDQMGIIVMDEAFDMWRCSKGQFFGSYLYFDSWWRRDIESMVKRDRSHPCVISYSTGNEIPETNGSWGDDLSAAIAAEIRKYDNTRLVTSAVTTVGTPETWGQMTEKYWHPLDICGYNYMYNRYAADHEIYPERVIWGSETKALEFYDSWKATVENNHVIGDFTWTAFDNLGEAGTGRMLWARDGIIDTRNLTLGEYPWRSCYQGDLDLCGYRRPQSYFREAVWIGGTKPKIFTTHPEHYGEKFTGTGWHWHDVLDSWTFDDEYIGKPVKCEVYTDADEIEWIINGRKLGKSIPQKAIATFDIPYEKGELVAVAYKNGKECGRSALKTVEKAALVKILPEKTEINADNRDLCYLNILITDNNGDRVPDAKYEITCTVSGGELMGVFSGDPCNEDRYGSGKCHTFYGRALAVVRSDKAGTVTVNVGSDGLLSETVNITSK